MHFIAPNEVKVYGGCCTATYVTIAELIENGVGCSLSRS